MAHRDQALRAKPTLRGHIAIARVDHWVKNVFVLPGIIVGLSLDPTFTGSTLVVRTLLALLATGLIASSNYTLNEILDAPFDAHHPLKQNRPIPRGLVHIGVAYSQWLLLAALGLALGWSLGRGLALSLLALWIMGCVYNVPPVRSKDVPYVDVLTEAINNPLRMLIGWYVASTVATPPLSLLLCYWMVGCYFMAIKRLAEVRQFRTREQVAAYRRSLAYFTEPTLLVAITFYGSTAMLFFGAFIMRYRLELILAFPLVALVMARYLSLAFKEDSAAQHPEKLYREPSLMASVVACTLLMTTLFFVDVPLVRRMFAPTIPAAVQPLTVSQPNSHTE